MIEQKGSENNNSKASRSENREQDIEASRLQTETGLAPVPPLGVVAVRELLVLFVPSLFRGVGLNWVECLEKATVAFFFSSSTMAYT